jgi:D-alanine--D-alanine ligase
VGWIVLEQKNISVWAIFSHPDHYYSCNGPSDQFRARIAREIENCKSLLIKDFPINDVLELKFVFMEDLLALKSNSPSKPHVVLFLMESRNFEDGVYAPPLHEFELKGYLKTLGIAYTGCDGLSLFSDYDKSLQYSLALSCGIATPKQAFISQPHENESREWDIFPAFVKPCLHGDSIGIRKSSVVFNHHEMVTEIKRLQSLFPAEPLVIQEFLEGNEYTVGIMGNWDDENCYTLPLIQIGYEKAKDEVAILTHDAKNNLHSSEYMQDFYHIANLPEALKEKINTDTLKIYKRLKCRGYARADWRLDKNGTPKFLEINALPDIMDHASSIVKMHRSATGGNHSDFMLEIIRHAIK